MPCLLGFFALIAPRVVLVVLWIFSDYVGTAHTSMLWPVLGFFFLPVTTLAHAWAWHHQPSGSVQGVGLVVVVIAILIDLGIIGGASRKRQQESD